MKIATVSNAAVVHTRRWVETLRARGHEVRLWSLEPGPAGLGAQALPAAPAPEVLRYPLAAPALARALADFAPDVVDSHNVPNYGLLAALAGRRPLSVSAWGSDLLITGPRDAFQRARTRFVLGRADLVIADAENLARAARALGGAPDRVHAVPWGVDLGRLRPGPAREPGLILSARMHEAIYDVEAVIDAAAAVLARVPHARLVVAGDGSRRAALERRAAAKLPAGRWRFVGRLDAPALADWLGRAEVYVSASHSDSTSVTLLEAMACGAVPVVSDIEGNREWVDGVGARTFPVGDAGALAVALEGALADAGWRAGARARNRAEVERRGDRAVNFGRIEGLFEAIASRPVR